MDCRRRRGCTGSLHRDCTARRDYRGSRLRRGCKDYTPHTGYTGWPLHRGCTGCRGRTVRRRLHMDYTGCKAHRGCRGSLQRMGCRGYTGCTERRGCRDCTWPRGAESRSRSRLQRRPHTGCRRRTDRRHRRRDRRRPRTGYTGCRGCTARRRRTRRRMGCRDCRDRMVRRLRRLPHTAGTDCTVRKGCTKRRGAPPGLDAAGSPPGFRRRMRRPRRGRRRWRRQAR